MIRNYIKVAFRSLWKNKGFSLINILGLAIGLTCSMLLIVYIWYESSYDNYHPELDRLYQFAAVNKTNDGKQRRGNGSPHSVAGLLQTVYPQVEATGRIAPMLHEDKTQFRYATTDGSVKTFYEEKGMMADSGFFHLFRYDFVEGNAATAISGPYSIVISSDIAGKLFGSEPALNKTVRISSSFNGDHEYTVTGVFKPIKRPSHIDARFFLSMYGGYVGELLRTQNNMASNGFFVTYLRLKPNVDPIQFEKGFPAFVDKYMGRDLKAVGSGKEPFLLKVRDIHLHSDMENGNVTPGGSMTYLFILGSIALFTVLIACINFMNLATARSGKRSAEVGVRKTLGAARSSLISQFLGESLIMAFISFIIALGLTLWLLGPFAELAGKDIWLTNMQTLQLAGVFLLLTIFTGLLAGSYPAFYLSSFQPVKVLKGKITNTLAAVALRKGLVIFQFCISIILIVSAAIIGSQMRYLRQADLGFKKDQQLILPLRSSNARQLYMPLKTELANNSAFISVGASLFYPGTRNFISYFNSEGKNASDNVEVNINLVDQDFLKTLGLQAMAGHLFSRDFSADTADGMIVNEKAIRSFGYTVPESIGKRLIFSANSARTYKIVGVVKDFHFQDLHSPIGNIGFLINSNPEFYYIIANFSAGQAERAIASARGVWQKLNPNEPFEYTFLDEEFQKHYEADTRVATIVTYAMLIAIFISCLGLFGLTAFSAEQRRREIGIRKVLGASQTNLISLLSKDFLKLVIISVFIGTPLGWFVVNKWMENFAYRTSISWTLFVYTTLGALLIALLTISFQAIRASLASPVKNLRTE